MFVPYDDYLDLDSELWADVKDANDSMIWDGKHYVAAVEVTGDNCAIIYNRKTIDENGLDDPAELFEKGKWDWDAFQDMLSEFVDTSNEHRCSVHRSGGRQAGEQPAQRGNRGLPELDV